MDNLEKQLIYFTVMLNPFAQIIALWDLMKQMSWREFMHTYGRATFLSLGVYILFIFFGHYLVDNIFQIRLSALRIFGGALMISIAYRNISSGVKTNVLLNAKVSDLAPEISLPYIIGPATIWLCILIGQSESATLGLAGIAVIMFANWFFLVLIHRVISDLERQRQSLVGKYFAVLMRTNSLFIGAIGVDMILSGLLATFPMVK